MLTSTKDTRVVQPQATKDINVVQVKVTKDTSLKAKFNVITLTLAIIGLTSVVDVPAEAAAAAVAVAAAAAKPAGAAKPAAAGAPAAGGTPNAAATGATTSSTLENRDNRVTQDKSKMLPIDEIIRGLKYSLDIPNTGWGRRSHDCLQTLMGLVLYDRRINLSGILPPQRVKGQWQTWLDDQAQVDEIKRLNEQVKQISQSNTIFNRQTRQIQDEILNEIQLQIQRNLAWRYWLPQMRTIKSMQDFTVPTLTKDTSGKERTYTLKKMNEIIMAFWALVTKEGREELERKSGTDDTAITVRDVIVDALCQFACAQALDNDTGAPTIGTVYNGLKKSKLVDIKSHHPMLNPKDVNNTDKNKRANGQLYNELKDVNKLSDDLTLEQTELFQGIFKKVDALYEDSKKQGGEDTQKIQDTLLPGQDLREVVEAKLAELEKQLNTELAAGGPVETEPNEGDTTPPAANNVQPAAPPATPPADAKPATSAQTAAATPPADAKPATSAQTAAAKSPAANNVQTPAAAKSPTGAKVTTPGDSVTKPADPTPAATKANPALPAISPAANNVPPAAPILTRSASLPADDKKSNSGSVLGRATLMLGGQNTREIQGQINSFRAVLGSGSKVFQRSKTK